MQNNKSNQAENSWGGVLPMSGVGGSLGATRITRQRAVTIKSVNPKRKECG